MARVKLVPALKGRVDFYDPRVNGVNATLLSRWKSCRHRALIDLNGWTPRLVSEGGIYGQIVHSVFQHVYDLIRLKKVKNPKAITKEFFAPVVRQCLTAWKADNPRVSAEILQRVEFVGMLVDAVIPLYFSYHAADFQDMIWDPPEQPFKIPYTVQTEKWGPINTFLKGRVDGTFASAKTKKPTCILLETKTKSRIDPEALVEMLPHDLQVEIYLKAMTLAGQHPTALLYNVVRRPGMKQSKKESLTQLAQRIIKDIKKQPEHYFLRFRMDLRAADLVRQAAEVDTIVTDFIRWWAGDVGHYRNSDHCENKYGRCEFLGTLCGGADEGKPNPARFYKRKTVFRPGEEDVV